MAQDPLPKWLQDIVRSIYDGKDFSTSKDGLSQFFQSLWSGVTEGYGTGFEAMSIDDPDFETLATLQRDVIRFSNAKDYAMQRSMVQALVDGTGKLRSWSDYRTAAYAIGNVQSDVWLAAEWDLSISSGQMASKWKGIVKNADVLPLLEFDAILDNRTSHTCRLLNGVTLPVDHWFWKQFYPPNHWGCRSTVRQKSGGKITDLKTVHLPDIPVMFQTNLASRGHIFPPDHPYWQGFNPTPADDIKAMRGLLTREARVKYEGQSVQVDGLGPVTINWQGIKKIGSQPHSDKEKQLQLLNVLPALLKEAKLHSSAPSQKGGTGTFHYAIIKNQPDINLVLETDEHGTTTLYTIVDAIKNTR